MTTTQSNVEAADLAIIGMSARFPGAADLRAFWQNLAEGRECVTEFAEEDLRRGGVPEEIWRHPDYVKAGVVLEGVDLFDAGFFGFSPREAEVMDPQFRLFLEAAWSALEDAGYDAEQYPGAIGVFAGAAASRYFLTNLLSQREGLASGPGALPSMGQLNDRDTLSTLVSFKLNLTGPSLTVQTACSTSLAALHLAGQSLLSGESDLALAGGVSLSLPQRVGYLYQEGNILSPDGHCRPFDARAKGTLAGSGLGVVVVKRLSDAESDGDAIYARIKGSALNNDGARKASYTAPSVVGQSKVVAEALAMAGISADEISYVEAHGTGTELGDPIEVEALTRAFRRSTSRRGYCALGSVKGNLGHLDRAAGMASLIKTVLALQHRQIPPTLHFERPNPRIDFQGSPFYVNAQLADWAAPKGPRLAGVSSLGIGGTNVHVVLEEAPAAEAGGPGRPSSLVLLSAKSPSALDRACDQLAQHLEEHPAWSIGDVAYTLQVGRRAFEHRRFVVASDLTSLIRGLRQREDAASMGVARDPGPVWFFFSGETSGALALGATLYESEPAFRESIDACADAFRPLVKRDVRDGILRREPSTGGLTGLEREVWWSCGLFAFEYGLASLWMSWGIAPAGVLGLGVGRYVAAGVAGVMSLGDAASLAVHWCQSHKEGGGKALSARARQVRLNAPRLRCYSTRSGKWLRPEEAAQPHHWECDEEGGGGRFGNAVVELAAAGGRVVEVGPGGEAYRLPRFQDMTGADIEVLSSFGGVGASGSVLSRLLATLGQLWVRGIAMDAPAFYAREQRRRVHLPTYPFERQSYWIETRTAERKPRAAATNPEERLGIHEWFYVPSWRCLPAGRRESEMLADEAGCWLIFVDRCGLGEALACLLEGKGAQVVRVVVGDAFSESAGPLFKVRPSEVEDYRRLVARLKEWDRLPKRVVHCWNTTADDAAESEWDRFDEHQATGFFSLVCWSQAWLKETGGQAAELDVVSNRTQDVSGQELVCPAKVTVAGPCKVIAQEYPQIRCRHVDVGLSAGGEVGEVASSLLIALRGPMEHPVVALRGRQRWVLAYDRVALPQPPSERLPLRQGGVYLVTGGLGGLGFAFAQALAKRCQPKLVLTGRTVGLRSDSGVGAGSGSGGSGGMDLRSRRVEALQALGAEVWVVPADVGDEEAMRRLWNETEVKWGPIHGVIHAAGVRTPAAVSEVTLASAEPHFRAKARGLCVLGKLVGRRPLDFCLVTSSLASVLGGLGSTAYTAANAFMDAYVQCRNREGDPVWMSVNFDSWQTEETAAGRPGGRGGVRLAMTASEGVEVFERVLAFGPMLPVAVSVADLPSRLAQWTTSRKPTEPVAEALLPKPSRHPRPQLSNAFVPPGTPVERRLAEIWQELLGIEQVGMHDNFFDLGGHSLLLTALHARLREVFQVEVPVIELFRYPTVGALAGRLSGSANLATFGSVEERARQQQQSRPLARRSSATEASPEDHLAESAAGSGAMVGGGLASDHHAGRTVVKPLGVAERDSTQDVSRRQV